jgi:hypothetical protein
LSYKDVDVCGNMLFLFIADSHFVNNLKFIKNTLKIVVLNWNGTTTLGFLKIYCQFLIDHLIPNKYMNAEGTAKFFLNFGRVSGILKKVEKH